MAALTEFLLILAAAWVATTALYFGLGRALERLCARHPGRRIQRGRDGRARARVEIAESLRSIAVTSACLALAIVIQRHGLALWPAPTGWIWTLGATAALILLYDAWFYWAHRLLHTRPFWRFHRWHHHSAAPTVWSSDSQSPVETLLIQGFMPAAALLLPIPPLALVLHRLYDHVNGQIGHCGHEFLADRSTRFPSPMVCATFHDQHHERFDCNYANSFSLWDRLMGTISRDYDARVAATEARDREIAK